MSEQEQKEVNEVLRNIQRMERIKAVGAALNILCLLFIIVGFIFNTSMPYWLIELHGAITGIFLLGTFNYVYSRRRNS